MLKLFKLFLFLTLLSHNLLASESALSILTAHGLKDEELSEAVKKYPELMDTEIASEFQSEDYSLKLYSENTDEVYIVTKSDAGMSITKWPAQFEVKVAAMSGGINGTLSETILRETNSHKLAKEMAESFKDDFSTTKGLRGKASYSFSVTEYFDEGRFIKHGKILSATLIIGRAISTKTQQMNPETFSWELLPKVDDLNEKSFYAPVRSSRVSSLFQLDRRHPVTRRHQPHNGIDFVAPSGVAVYPALEGEVITISRSRSKGKFITLQHDNGYQTTYIHLKRVQKGLKVGMRVGLDDQIGEVGRTGYATGAHLHFGVIQDGYFVNPIPLLKSYCYDQKDQFENLDPEVDEKVISEDDSSSDEDTP